MKWEDMDLTPRIEPGIVVEWSGKRGVTERDEWNCCSEAETPVIFYGNQNAGMGVLTRELKKIGPENPIPDQHKCGIGQGAECCKFLVIGANGFECARHSSLRINLMCNTTMTAQREPDTPWPECMNQ